MQRIRQKLLNVTASTVTLGTGAAEDKPVTTVTEKVITEETRPGLVKAGSETVKDENGKNQICQAECRRKT